MVAVVMSPGRCTLTPGLRSRQRGEGRGGRLCALEENRVMRVRSCEYLGRMASLASLWRSIFANVINDLAVGERRFAGVV